LRTRPDDASAWARLGSLYVQQARITGDPTYYPKAAGALDRSLRLQPAGNVEALTGRGALLNAQHRFSDALRQAQAAARIDPYDGTVQGVLDDALTQLGDDDRATAAAQRMLDLQPGIASFARASYHYEQHGQMIQARAALERALTEADSPADVAFCRLYLGEIAFSTGDPDEALRQYQAGLRADPGYDPLTAGRAKVYAALDRPDDARRDYAAAVSRVPQPQYVLEYAELLEFLGRRDEAQEQWKLLATEQTLLAANGVQDDLLTAVVAADHGKPADALRAGRDQEALRYADLADRHGWRNATFLYHRGMIELALGRRTAAERHLRQALTLNPSFSVKQAPLARKALSGL
jgi:tetratricopeptide (TPR) repeat protein